MLVFYDPGIPLLGISLRLGPTGLMTDIVCDILFTLQSLTQDPLLGTQILARNKTQEHILCCFGARGLPVSLPGGGGEEQVIQMAKACRLHRTWKQWTRCRFSNTFRS